jgi:branched-subunit amino acid aminotransferase/4-amino-4-deoxychorismate lyase
MAIVQYNGKLLPWDELKLAPENRGFFYGDGFFETIRLHNGKGLWAEDHLDRMNRSFSFLQLPPPFSLDIPTFNTMISGVAHANQVTEGGRVRITFFRESSGLYTPAHDRCGYLIQCSPLDQNRYDLNKRGLHLTAYHQNHKNASPLASLKTLNALIYVLAGIHARNQHCDDAMILNDQENIIETTSSNLFIVKGQKIITPGLDEGCIPGVLRRNLLKIIENKTEYQLTRGNIKLKDVIEADEVFLTNVISGIRWVVGVREKRYYHTVASHLNELLQLHCEGR